MVNRRHLRIKVLQAVYGFFQDPDTPLKTAEENLLTSIEKIYDLYLFQLALGIELLHESYREREEAKNKYFPTPDDLMPETNFTRNRILNALNTSESLQTLLQKKKINWLKNLDIPQKIFRKVRLSDGYKAYFKKENPTMNDDREFMLWMYENFIFNDDILESYYEELNIHWADDIYVVNAAVLKTLRTAEENKPLKLISLFKDKEEDTEFCLTLFRKTILHEAEYEEMIRNKAQNWEVDRIAMMDIILMKMALAEILEMPSIPVKVTLNEYIDLSKLFSTPKSNAFVNGILDKLVAEFKSQNRIVKVGRGLIDQ
jgi:N utilization substance protein B